MQTGWRYFIRNGFVSLSAVLIMAVALFTVGGVMFLLALLQISVAEIENKIELTVSFSVTAPEEEIRVVRRALEALPQVEGVSYMTREQALEAFRTRNTGDTLILQALDEIGDNPLGATLSVRAREAAQYESIAGFLANPTALSPAAASVIERVNFQDNKAVFERLTRFTSAAERLGAVVSAAFGILALLIAFNTIRLIIYISREEIAVMLLVGATMRFVRTPFVVAGVLYGIIAACLVLTLFFPLTWWLRSMSADFFSGADVFRYYSVHFFEFAGLLFGAGALCGAVASALAVRKYLKI